MAAGCCRGWRAGCRDGAWIAFCAGVSGWTGLRSFAAAALLFIAAVARAADSPLEAARFELVGEIELDGIGGASGLSYNAVRDSLFVIDDDDTALYEYSRDGVLRRRIALDGFEDTEDVAWLGQDEYALIEERTGLLLQIRIGDTTRQVARSEAIELKRLGSSEHNDGVEGLAYAADRGNLYFVHELHPRAVSVLNLAKTSFARVTPLWTLPWYSLGPRDYSGIAYRPESGLLWPLSDVSASLTEYTPTGNEVGSMRLRDTQGERIRNAEGIALDREGRMYIVAEPNRLYLFKPKFVREAR